MAIPKYVSQGDPMRASWANDVVGEVINSKRRSNTILAGRQPPFAPFDPIDLYKKDGFWYIKVQKARYYSPTGTEGADILYGSDPLSDYPEIKVEEGKHLFFSPKDKNLVWRPQTAEENGMLKILHFEPVDDGFEITNRYRRHIDFRNLPPFSKLVHVAESGTGVKLAVTHGYLCERMIPAVTEGGVKNQVPEQLVDGPDYVWHDLGTGQELAIEVKVNKVGPVDGVPKLVVQEIDKASNHWYPPCADGYGMDGTFYYVLYKRESTGIDTVLGGSHVDHFQDIPHIEPATGPGEGIGRVVKEYVEDADTFFFRSIQQRQPDGELDAQIKVIESIDTVLVQGNGNVGSFSVTLLDGSESEPTATISWEDGLVTTAGNQTVSIPVGVADGSLSYKLGNESTGTALISWQKGLVQEVGAKEIPIPKYVAGTGITITPSGANEFVVASTVTGIPEGYTEKTLWVCEDGTPTQYTFLVKTVGS